MPQDKMDGLNNIIKGFYKMIIIAFSNKTSKILPRLLCRNFRHVAPINVTENNMIMYQFVRPKIIKKISLNMRDIHILGMYGWKFIYINGNIPHDFNPCNAKTCVQLTKRAIKLHNWRIQTPYALYNILK
ncbi:MAG: hypothetical protein E7006_00130 [Alphaproteobacteria bacterium]|nr:hypothetical protein [Alphaproteobacteria bacterium]